MKISTTTGYLARHFGDEVALEKLARAGFDAVDYSMFIHDAEKGVYNTDGFEDYAKNLKKTADNVGIVIGQIHAQIPRPSCPDYLGRTELWDRLAKRSIITSAIVDCPYVVVHPIIMPDRRYDVKYQENFDLNVEYFGKMKDTAKEYGVKVAIENMWHSDDVTKEICPSVCSSSAELLSLCETLGDEFVVCLDTGHTVLTGRSPESMIYDLGDKLKVLHISDNDGYDDTHDIPYNGLPVFMNSKAPAADRRFNWDAVMTALKDIGYSGTFSLEADSYPNKFPEELAEDVHVFMAKVARHMVDKYGL